MSVQRAKQYAISAKNAASNPTEAARLFELAFMELCKTVKQLEFDVESLKKQR
jgi:hypothetical protein